MKGLTNGVVAIRHSTLVVDGEHLSTYAASTRDHFHQRTETQTPITMAEIAGLIETLETLKISLANSEAADLASFGPAPAAAHSTLPTSPPRVSEHETKVAELEALVASRELAQRRLADAAAQQRHQADAAAATLSQAHADTVLRLARLEAALLNQSNKTAHANTPTPPTPAVFTTAPQQRPPAPQPLAARCLGHRAGCTERVQPRWVRSATAAATSTRPPGSAADAATRSPT